MSFSRFSKGCFQRPKLKERNLIYVSRIHIFCKNLSLSRYRKIDSLLLICSESILCSISKDAFLVKCSLEITPMTINSALDHDVLKLTVASDVFRHFTTKYKSCVILKIRRNPKFAVHSSFEYQIFKNHVDFVFG